LELNLRGKFTKKTEGKQLPHDRGRFSGVTEKEEKGGWGSRVGEGEHVQKGSMALKRAKSCTLARALLLQQGASHPVNENWVSVRGWW